MVLSIEEYLKRETTEKLETFLKNYAEGTLTEDFSNAVPLVRLELDRRKTAANTHQPQQERT